MVRRMRWLARSLSSRRPTRSASICRRARTPREGISGRLSEKGGYPATKAALDAAERTDGDPAWDRDWFVALGGCMRRLLFRRQSRSRFGVEEREMSLIEIPARRGKAAFVQAGQVVEVI